MHRIQTSGALLAPWSLAHEDFDERDVGRREAIFALGNGLFVTRAAALDAGWEGPGYPGTYRAGLYDRARSCVAGQLEHEDLVNLPNWLFLSWSCAAGVLRGGSTLLAYRQELEVRRGLLTIWRRVSDAEGRVTRTRERRLVHMGHPHLAALELTIEPENWSGELVLESRIDGRARNGNVARYAAADGVHLEVLEAAQIEPDTLLVRTRTRGTRVEVTLAARTRISDGTWSLETLASAPDGVAGLRARGRPSAGARTTVEKVMTLFTGRDPGVADSRTAALRELEAAPAFEALLASHEAAWARLWDRFFVEVHGEPEITGSLRLHLMHILQTLSPNTEDLDAGVPARGWHGEGYRGHVFWDELFVLPLLMYRLPHLARALLAYRWRRLPEARRAARAAGHRGAMFPWRSASDGREVTDRLRLNPRSSRWLVDHTRLERHIGAAVAHNVWHYYQVTGDLAFLESQGAELLLDIAKFWSSLAELDEQWGRYVVRGVVGPDEFHDAYPGAGRPGIDNNAYTNVLIAWCLERALEVLDVLSVRRRAELTEQLELTAPELERWRDMTRRLFVPFSGRIMQQFEGYEALAGFPWERYREAYGDIHRLDDILEAEGDSPNRYQASKQADVLMLFFLLSKRELSAVLGKLGYPLSDAELVENTRYYLARTSHGSTLSRVVHAWVLARSDRAGSWALLKQALGADLDDVQGGTTPEGLHLGAMAGTVDLFQRCYSGLEARNGVLVVEPRLPDELAGLSLRLCYRECWLDLSVSQKGLRVRMSADAPHPISLRVRQDCRQLGPGEEHEFSL